MGVALFFLAATALVVWGAIATAGKKEARNTALDQIASHLRGARSNSQVTGTSRGVDVTFRFETRGSGSTSESWTEIDLVIPPAYPLAIHIRRHGWRDRHHIEAHTMVDVEVGDAAFDQAFLVEAAPADVVKVLLDADARRLLASHDRVELDTMAVADKRVLRFAVRGWIEDVPAAIVAIDGAAQIGARIRDAFTAVEDATPAVERGSPYRPMLDDQPVRDAAAARQAEVAKVETVRAERNANTRLFAVCLFILFIVGSLLLAMSRS